MRPDSTSGQVGHDYWTMESGYGMNQDKEIPIEILSNRYGRLSLPTDRPVELDLGCGKGGFLRLLAERYPDRLVIGVDVMLGRLRKLARHCKREQRRNVRLLRVEAWPLVDSFLADEAVDRVHVLCPDPWPKTKHRANRLIIAEFLNRLLNKLKPGGTLHLATDNQAYFDQMQRAAEAVGERLIRDPAAIADVRDLKTDFERGFEADGIPVQHAAWRRHGTG